MRHTHALVTVGYEADFPLLRLQARSAAARVSPTMFSDVVVLDNSRFGFGPARRRALRRAFGPLAHLVRFLTPKDLGGVPRGTYGWTSQQVLKLQVARVVSAERYLVLDAKNVLVRELSPAFLEDEEGRPRVRAYSYTTHPLRPALERTLAYLGVPLAGHVDRFSATVTPFVLETQVVRDLLDHLEAGGRSALEVFVDERLTEFFLYAGWTIARGTSLEEAFDLSLERSPNVWPKQGTAELEKELLESASGTAPFFTVHQRGLAGFDEERSELLARFWADAGLFPDAVRARAELERCRRTFATAGRRWNKRPHLFLP